MSQRSNAAQLFRCIEADQISCDSQLVNDSVLFNIEESVRRKRTKKEMKRLQTCDSRNKKIRSNALWLGAVAMVVKYNCRSSFAWNCDSMWFS